MQQFTFYKSYFSSHHNSYKCAYINWISKEELVVRSTGLSVCTLLSVTSTAKNKSQRGFKCILQRVSCVHILSFIGARCRIQIHCYLQYTTVIEFCLIFVTMYFDGRVVYVLWIFCVCLLSLMFAYCLMTRFGQSIFLLQSSEEVQFRTLSSCPQKYLYFVSECNKRKLLLLMHKYIVL